MQKQQNLFSYNVIPLFNIESFFRVCIVILVYWGRRKESVVVLFEMCPFTRSIPTAPCRQV